MTQWPVDLIDELQNIEASRAQREAFLRSQWKPRKDRASWMPKIGISSCGESTGGVSHEKA